MKFKAYFELLRASASSIFLPWSVFDGDVISLELK